jgi:hypothetical protein
MVIILWQIQEVGYSPAKWKILTLPVLPLNTTLHFVWLPTQYALAVSENL